MVRDSARRLGRALRDGHVAFALLLAAGVLLRVTATVAYEGAYLHPDSLHYLGNADDLVPQPIRPMGYPVLLWLLPGDALLPVVLVQHGLGLLVACALYVLLVRLEVPPWLAALAAAPVLLDAFQLVVEHQVVSEPLFEALLAGAVVLLLWRRPPGLVACAGAGALLAAAALTRGAATLLIVPALVAAFLLHADRRALALMLAGFALPVVLYMASFQAANGTFSTTGFGGRFLYGRVAPFADCRAFPVPAEERVLCPAEPLERRRHVGFYIWSPESPVYRVADPQSAGSFARRVILHQPLDYLSRVGAGMLRGFSLTRETAPGEPPVGRLKFLREPQLYTTRPPVVGALEGRGEVREAPASALRAYQAAALTPGPLLGLALVAGAAAALGLGRARRSPLRVAAFLFCSLAVVLLFTSMAVNEFSWRYWVPELVLIPPAGALGIAALTRRRTP